MIEEDYKTYLNRLKQLVYIELVTKVAVFDYFSEHAPRYGESRFEVEPLLWPIISGLHYDVTLSLYRLVHNRSSDRNILHFLKITKAVRRDIAWMEPVEETDIDRFLDRWAAKADVISNLVKRRNKFFAHYDKEHFLEPDVSLGVYPFDVNDAKDLTRLLQDTVSFFNGCLYGSRPLSMEGFVYSRAERLFETMREAWKETEHAENERNERL